MDQPAVTGVAATPAAGVATTAQPVAPAQPNVNPQTPEAGAAGTAPAGQPAAPAQQVTVPVTVVQALRDELQQAKTRAEQVEQQFNVFRANAATWQANMGGGQPASQPAAPAPAANPFDGMRDDDVLTVSDVKKIIERLPSASAPVVDNDLKMTVMKLELAQIDPQYETTIRTYLPEVLASDPSFRTVIAMSPNPLKTALTLSRTNPKYIAAKAGNGGTPPSGQPMTPLDQLSLILANLEKPGNPGQFGGAPVGAGNAGRFAQMTDEEFDAHVRRVRGGV